MVKSLAQAELEARSIVNWWAVGAGIVSFVPGSSLVLGAADIKMVHDVARSFDVAHFNIEEITTAIAATITGRIASDGILTFVPIVGWAVKAGVAAVVTKSAGEVVIRYFKARSALS